ncbi:MAG TPA: hypothetical protein VL154_06430 [Acetobacteraceae bacterium]|nr:hypothetical protein [Acetobacteraceae bacterium]
MTRKISTAIAGPVSLSLASDNPLIITNLGTITSTGANSDGVDGTAARAWAITNRGMVSSDAGWGINLAGAGSLDNSGAIYGFLGGFLTGGRGTVTNGGTINGAGGDGVFLNGNGTVTNREGASISGDGGGVKIFAGFGAGFGRVTNAGTISGGPLGAGVFIKAVGDVTNKAGGVITGVRAGVSIDGARGLVANAGAISGTGADADGVLLGAGGVIVNRAGGSISGDRDGILVGGAAGTVVNAGAISATNGNGVEFYRGGSLTNHEGGSISTGSNGSGVVIDGGSGTVANSGTISGGFNRVGVSLNAGGSVTNREGGLIDAGSRGLAIEIAGGIGAVTNSGAISAGAGIQLEAGGSVTNRETGFIEAGFRGVAVGIDGGVGTVTNWGTISGRFGVDLVSEGHVTNHQGGSISGSGLGFGVDLELGGSVANNGAISGRTGVALSNGGSVTNRASGSISGNFNGVEVIGGSGTITNQGTISGGTHSVLFDAGSTNSRLVITPDAVFSGSADATAATSTTIELTQGNGAISGIGDGNFLGFNRLEADAGANWTLGGTNNTIASVLNNGKLEVTGGLNVSAEVDQNSAGIFKLDGGSTFEVAKALGINSQIRFETGSELVVDHYGLFGQNVGTSGYAGSLLRDFGDAAIDLKDFNFAGITSSFSASTGLLQLTNSTLQMATLDFQTSSLGFGAFHFASDGGGGVLIMHS